MPYVLLVLLVLVGCAAPKAPINEARTRFSEAPATAPTSPEPTPIDTAPVGPEAPVAETEAAPAPVAKPASVAPAPVVEPAATVKAPVGQTESPKPVSETVISAAKPSVARPSSAQTEPASASVAASPAPAAPSTAASKPSPAPAPPEPDRQTDPSAQLSRLSGVIRLTGSGALAPTSADLADTVVYFVPAKANKPRAGEYSMITQGKVFEPSLLIVPVGSTVTFPNFDPVRHNVYSATPGASFDLGFYGEGETRAQVFAAPGMVTIQCNVHRTMQARVLVLPSAYFTRAGSGGEFELSNLPPGPGVLHVWHPRASDWKQSLTVPSAAVRLSLPLTKPRGR